MGCRGWNLGLRESQCPPGRGHSVAGAAGLTAQEPEVRRGRGRTLGSVQDRRIWKKVCPGEERGQLLPWEEAPIGRIYTSDRSPLGGGVLSASLGILLSVLLLGVSQWSGHCRPTSTPRFLVPCGCHLSGGERLVCSFWVSPQLLASPAHSPWSPGPCTFGPASFWGCSRCSALRSSGAPLCS